MTRGVYLDHNASTPVDPRALESMMAFLTTEFGNPSSTTHGWGRRARQAVEEARASLALLLGSRPEEICFTSGATESNNLAIKGCARRRARDGAGSHLVTTAIEHPSVLETVRDLEREGFRNTVLQPDSEGRISPEAVEAAIGPGTILVSVLSASGEIGTVQPVEPIGHLCRERGVVFHTDGTQAVGKLPVDVGRSAVDLLALSAHKFYGPKGVGALFVRSGVDLDPLLSGGGQERGLRSGTLNVPGIVGLGTMAAIVSREMETESPRLRALSEMLWNGIRERVPDARRNGHPTERLPGTMNVAFPRVPSERLMTLLEDFGVSASPACHSGKGEASPVLTAIGLDPALASCSVRFGLGHATTEDDVRKLLEDIGRAVHRIRGPGRRASATAPGV